MKLAYITTCFGTPSHTFIRREIREFEATGTPVTLYGVRRDTSIADDAQDLVARTAYLYPLRYLQLLGLILWYATRYAGRFWPAAWACLTSSSDNLKNRAKLLFHLLVSTRHARAMDLAEITHLHAHFLNVSSSIAMFSAWLADIPFSITVHSAGERDLPHVAGIPLKLKRAQRLLMISEFNIRYYSELFPCEEKSVVVRCGMNLDTFVRRPFRAHNNQPLQVLAVGRFVEKKGFHILVEAAQQLKASAVNARIELLGDGPMKAELERIANAKELNNILHFLGHASSDTVKHKMAEADLVVVPSVTSASGEMEGIPVVLMEAMASGVPVIASAHSGIPELVTENTGVLVAEGDASALADAIARFEPDAEKIEAAHALIESQFNIHHVVAQRRALFQEPK